jgi:mono/diheme cytochrome c family protein
MRGRLFVAATALVLFASSGEAAEPNYNYALRCTGCHTAEGVSPEAGRIPPLKGVVGHLVRTDAARLYFVNVPGIVNAALSDAETAALLNWVVTTYGEASEPKEWKRFDTAEIKSLRAKAPADIIAYRKEVEEQLRAEGHEIGAYP